MPFDLQDMYNQHPNLAFYGEPGMGASERRSLTLTNQDELTLIVRSLMILDIVANQELDDTQAATILLDGFKLGEYSEFGFDFDDSTDVDPIVKNVAYLRSLLFTNGKSDTKMIKEVTECFILHDLGKCTRFVETHNLAAGSAPTVSAHDFYLERYFASRKELHNQFKQHEKIINILDLLGHSPKKLQEKTNDGSASLRKVNDVDFLIERFKERCNTNSQNKNTTEIEIRKTIIEQSNIQAKKIEYPELTIDCSNKFTELSDKHKRYIAFLMWTAGLRFNSKTQQVMDFQKAFLHPDNRVVVNKMTELLMKNLELENGCCALYNPANLLHKPDKTDKTDKTLKNRAFIGSEASGGWNATMDEVVKVGFEFIIDYCENNYEDSSEQTVHNKFQISQMLELTPNHILQLAGMKHKQKYSIANFSPKENELLGEKLVVYRNQVKLKTDQDSDSSNQPNPQNLSMLVLRGFLLALGAGTVALAFVVLGTTTPVGVAALAVGGLVMGASLFGLFRGCCSKPQDDRSSDPLPLGKTTLRYMET
jgi:hypothetical protein